MKSSKQFILCLVFLCSSKYCIATNGEFSNDLVLTAIADSVSTDFSFSTELSSLGKTLFGTNVVMECSFRREAGRNVYYNLMRDFTIYQIHRSSESLMASSRLYEKYRWMFNDEYILFWFEKPQVEASLTLRLKLEDKLKFYGYTPFTNRIIEDKMEGVDVEAGTYNWYLQILLSWLESSGSESEFMRKKSAVAVRLLRKYSSCEEYVSYSNGYASGYAFCEMRGQPLPYILDAVNTNKIHVVFVEAWIQGEIDAQRSEKNNEQASKNVTE